MPTYQYECDNCSHSFEVLQSITEPKLRKCPKCARMKLSRLIGTGSGVIFKGSGFYETDYKRKDVPKTEQPPAKADKEACQNTGTANGGSACACTEQ